jgi:hypothetical protein
MWSPVPDANKCKLTISASTGTDKVSVSHIDQQPVVNVDAVVACGAQGHQVPTFIGPLFTAVDDVVYVEIVAVGTVPAPVTVTIENKRAEYGVLLRR